jgi:small-conductance mechanosensitive channel
MNSILIMWRVWAWSVAEIAAAVGLALLAHALFFRFAREVTARTKSVLDDSVLRHACEPVRLILPVVVVSLLLPTLRLPADWVPWIRQLLSVALIAAIAWLFIALIDVVEDLAAERFNIRVKDNLKARRIRTQVHVLRRVVTFTVSVVALALMLMTFPSVRQVGASILASAGLAGLVIGFAARPALSNLIAGIQIAIAEPIRIDDVVIVEGEWGTIEEINTTYVVVCIWDLRRLVVPLSYFMEKPFQNWTRTTANLLGTVFLYADYTVPVEEVRNALRGILESSKKWDGKVCNLQVTNATEHTVELRALMSAGDSSAAWDLRCEVREKLLAYLQQHYPQSLPRLRAEIHGGPGTTAAPAEA